MRTRHTTLKAGTNAYLESFAGLVLCRVLRVTQDARDYADYAATVDARVTRDCGAYRKGEIVRTTVCHMIPTGSVRRRKYSTVILPYSVELT